MGFIGMVVIIFVLIMTLITLLLIKKKVEVKKIFKIIIIILVLISCVIGGVSLYSQRSSSFIFTKTTNFNEENIAKLQLYESIDSEEFVKKYGTNLQRIDNALFDYYDLSDGLVIATNKNRQIIRIKVDDKSDNSIKTSKGINLESSIDDVIRAYGENYYKRIDDLGIPVIGYIDRKKKITLEFFYYENKVEMIRYDISSMQ